MTLKELSELRYLGKEIDLWERLLQESPLPGIGWESPKMQESMQIIQQNMERAVSEYNRLMQFIEGISDPLVFQVAYLRFVEGLSWDTVAARIGGGITENGALAIIRRYLKRAG